jgi:hypothetical protein
MTCCFLASNTLCFDFHTRTPVSKHPHSCHLHGITIHTIDSYIFSKPAAHFSPSTMDQQYLACALLDNTVCSSPEFRRGDAAVSVEELCKNFPKEISNGPFIVIPASVCPLDLFGFNQIDGSVTFYDLVEFRAWLHPVN